MANFNAVNYVKEIAVPRVNIDTGQVKGDLWVAYDEYTSLAVLTTADFVYTSIIVPPGAMVHAIGYVIPTNGGTIQLGTLASAAKYKAGLTPGAAITSSLARNATSSEERIIANPTVAATGTGLYQFAFYICKF